MSYDNAEPKILKTLNSSGQVLNDSGEVISDTSDYWTKLYNEAEPKPDKILYSDGTIKDSAGNLIQDTTEYNLKKYNQAEPIPAKYLHSDGTIDENSSSGGGADLDNNVAETIDVSTYTEPVVINPTSGKDGMKKATVTLSNIPSGDTTLYCWALSGDVTGYYYLNKDIAPTDMLDLKLNTMCLFEYGPKELKLMPGVPEASDETTFTRVSDTEFTITADRVDQTYTRTSAKDITLWEIN